MGRVGLAFRCFFRVLRGRPVPVEALPPEQVRPALPPADVARAEAQARAVQLIALLQKEARLLDFLQEDIDDYDDGQIGAAVRPIHRDCRRILQEYLEPKPVVEGQEDADFEVPTGFDPSQIRLIGNVTGDPPFQGVLRHHGWRAAKMGLPHPPKGADPAVIAPAEVELR